MAQNDMKAKPALPERVLSMEGLGRTCWGEALRRTATNQEVFVCEWPGADTRPEDARLLHDGLSKAKRRIWQLVTSELVKVGSRCLLAVGRRECGQELVEQLRLCLFASIL